MEAQALQKMDDVINKFYELFEDMAVDAAKSHHTLAAAENVTIGSRSMTDYSEAKTIDGEAISYQLKPGAREDVKKALNDKHFEGDVKLTENSPSILLSQKGVKNLPMVMKSSHIRENIFTENEARERGLKVNKNINYHGLGEELFFKVIEDLDNVTEAYRGTKNAETPERRENYFLLISKQTDENGNAINVPVFINKTGWCNRIFADANKIATVFGREELSAYVRRETKRGNLVRIKNRSTQVSESTSPINAGYEMNASTDSVSQPTQIVNSFSEENFGNIKKQGKVDKIDQIRYNKSNTIPLLSVGEHSLEEIQSIFKQGNTDPNLDLLFDKVYDFCQNANIRITSVSSFYGENDIWGKARGDKIELNLRYFNDNRISPQKKAQVILHEMLHAATTYAMKAYEIAKKESRADEMSNKLYKSCEKIISVYAEITKDEHKAFFRNERGIVNVREMLAELSNPYFVDKLKVTYRNKWNKLLDAILELLGFDSHFSEYAKLKKAVDTILSHPDYALASEYYNAISEKKADYYIDDIVEQNVDEADYFLDNSFDTYAATYYNKDKGIITQEEYSAKKAPV